MSLAVVVLAAGQGMRMHSSLPKVLHPIGGKAILRHIIETVSQINPAQLIIIHGHEGDQLKKAFAENTAITWVEQAQQLGTGHAALQALPALNDVDRVLILYGDIPLVSVDTLNRLLSATTSKTIGLITVELENPKGFGRIIRDNQGELIQIIEEKDASPEQKKITEINAGFFIVPKRYLEQWLPKLSAHNAQKERYLSDIVSQAHEAGVKINTIFPEFEWEVLGVNDKVQLAELERIYQRRQALAFMQQGVTLNDPNRLDVRGTITAGKDVSIDINVILEGQVTLGNRVKIGPNVFMKDTIVADDVQILANSVIEGAHLGQASVVGPFARVRPGTVLAAEARIGNFVEIKNATIGIKTKINHLSYIGDAWLGNEVNIGAGTITCNFDGKKKHKTVIGHGVFVGSDTQFIAPLTVGEKATIGAGTTVTRDVPANTLVHNRLEQRSIPNWSQAEKNKAEEE